MSNSPLVHGFVYLWFDRRRKMFYVGSHKGFEDDGYICSSSWMKRAYKKRPEDFKRRIIKKICGTENEIYIQEQKWLDLIPQHLLGKKYYNRTKMVCTLQIQGRKNVMSDESRRKLSETKKGKKFSEAHKKALSEARRKNKTSAMAGRKHSEEAKAKMSLAKKGKVSNRKGVKLSEETRRKLSESHKGQVPWNKGLKTKNRELSG